MDIREKIRERENKVKKVKTNSKWEITKENRVRPIEKGEKSRESRK